MVVYRYLPVAFLRLTKKQGGEPITVNLAKIVTAEADAGGGTKLRLEGRTQDLDVEEEEAEFPSRVVADVLFSPVVQALGE